MYDKLPGDDFMPKLTMAEEKRLQLAMRQAQAAVRSELGNVQNMGLYSSNISDGQMATPFPMRPITVSVDADYLRDESGKYRAVKIKALKNGYEVDGFVFHNVLQLSHWLSQNLAPVNADPSQEV